MNIVYVLVSDGKKDTYYEQACISVMTLKKYNPNAQVYFIVDKQTEATFIGKRTFHEKYGVNVISVETPAGMDAMRRSRYLKTTMARYVEGPFFYIDGDTVICDKLDGIDSSIEVGMVLDSHCKLNEQLLGLQKGVARWRKQIGFKGGINNGTYYNGGFCYCANTPRAKELFELWHSLWLENNNKVPVDQPYLNEANNRLNVITELDGKWNCQVSRYWPSLKYIFDGKILHYFATAGEVSPFDLGDKSIQKSILEDSHPVLDRILNKPKAAFNKVWDLNTDKIAVNFSQTSTYSVFLRLYRNCRPVFFVIDLLTKVVMFVPRKIKKAVLKK